MNVAKYSEMRVDCGPGLAPWIVSEIMLKASCEERVQTSKRGMKDWPRFCNGSHWLPIFRSGGFESRV